MENIICYHNFFIKKILFIMYKMKSVKPVVLLSFLFFVAVASNDFREAEADYEVSDLEERDDVLGDDYDYDDGDNEDIIYSGMISSKPAPNPPSRPSSPSLIKSPPSSFAPIQPPPCKKWRCRLNGYVPIWTASVSSLCKDNYAKLGIMAKANCQDQFCQKVCASF